MGHFGGGGVGHFGGQHIAGFRGEHFRHARGPFIGGGGFYNYGYDCRVLPAIPIQLERLRLRILTSNGAGSRHIA